MSKLTNAAFAHYANEMSRTAANAASGTLHGMADADMPAKGVVPLKKVEEFCGSMTTQINRMLNRAAGKFEA